jgi:hypothetical protein
MLDFEPDGNAIVHFEAGGSQREIRLPLADYLALVKSSRTLEELRILVFDWRPPEEKTNAATA